MLVCDGALAVVHVSCMHPADCTRPGGLLPATLHAADARGSAWPADVVIASLGIHAAPQERHAVVNATAAHLRAAAAERAALGRPPATLLLAGYHAALSHTAWLQGLKTRPPELARAPLASEYPGHAARGESSQLDASPEGPLLPGLTQLNTAARAAATHNKLRYIDLFCSSAPVLADSSASPDGLHFDDDTNFLKAQVLLGEVCQ